MRILFMVSPPFPRLQGKSRSMSHIDMLEGESVFNDPIEGDNKLPESPRLIISPPLHARRQKLARSQVSSSEYFSVTFEVDDSNEPDEFVVASKGTSLADALSAVCSRRGIQLSSVNVYLDAYKTPLPVLTTDTSWLGGKHLLIKGKDRKSQLINRSPIKASHSCPLRRKSGSYKVRGNRFFSVSSDETSTSEPSEKLLGKTTKQKWIGLFGNAKDPKMNQLTDQLNSYRTHGIPQMQSIDEDLEEALFNLEDKWMDVVRDAKNLTERQQQQQQGIWELVETEVSYIHTLRVITDLFLSCLCNLQSLNLLTEIDNTKLFSNILEVYSSNKYFWSQHLLPMLAHSRETGKPFNPMLVYEGFTKFDEIFCPYTKYCAEQSQCQIYCKTCRRENEMFTSYLVWCENQKDCKRWRLLDLLVLPMQRITKYSLLLKAIHKNTDDEQHKKKLQEMITCVDLFVNKVNITLKHKEDIEQITAIMSKIEPYDAVESKDDDLERIVKSYSVLDLTNPMPGCCNSQRRLLLLESDLKLKDNTGSKIDVHCFLFTDMLLICKCLGRKLDLKYKIVKPPLMVERLVVCELQRDPSALAVVYLTEYKVPSAAFLLYSSNNRLLKIWESNIKKAQELYNAAKLATAGAEANRSLLALNSQPSSMYDADWEDPDHEYGSFNLFSLKSPRESSKGSSLNHSHSGSVEMYEGCSPMNSVIGHSRGFSAENESYGLRASSQSSEEGILSSNPNERQHYHHSTLAGRRKCASPNTLSIQVPAFTHLGQSLPNLNEVDNNTVSVPSSSNNMLLAPPKGGPFRGISYPPPSPPLRRIPALTLSRNPPLIKTKHISASTGSSMTTTCDIDSTPIKEGPCNLSQDITPKKTSLLKKFSRSDTKRYHTTGFIDDFRIQDIKDSRIYKRLSWNYGRKNKQILPKSGNTSSGTTSYNSSSSSCDSASNNASRSMNESFQETKENDKTGVPVESSSFLVNNQLQLSAERRPVDPGGNPTTESPLPPPTSSNSE